MLNLTPDGLKVVAEIAARNGVTPEAAGALLAALAEGNGRQAQFRHPELGGMGQWSLGGMIMIGDMFNHDLKHRVDRMCNELAALLRAQPHASSQSQSQNGAVSLFASGSSGSRPWWPADLGVPDSVGGQNGLQYAYFPDSRRLSILQNGKMCIYNVGEHKITGFSQQQSGDRSLTFTSQFGLVSIADLPLVSPQPDQKPPVASPIEAVPAPVGKTASPSPPSTNSEVDGDSGSPSSGDAILAVIERLADLRQKNILSEEEFVAKKRELLSRL